MFVLFSLKEDSEGVVKKSNKGLGTIEEKRGLFKASGQDEKKIDVKLYAAADRPRCIFKQAMRGKRCRKESTEPTDLGRIADGLNPVRIVHCS